MSDRGEPGRAPGFGRRCARHPNLDADVRPRFPVRRRPGPCRGRRAPRCLGWGLS